MVERTDHLEVWEVSEPGREATDFDIAQNQSPKALELSNLIWNFCKALSKFFIREIEQRRTPGPYVVDLALQSGYW